MNLKKIIFGFLMSFIAFACSEDEMLNEKDNSIPNPQTMDYSLENETKFSVKSRTFGTNWDWDVKEDLEKPVQDFLNLPLCTGIIEGEYFPMPVTYSNFSSDRFIRRMFEIFAIRKRYNDHYNQGDCQLVIIPSNSGSITCEGETCTEIWYFFGYNSKPGGGGTVSIDVEAPGP